MFPPPPSSPYCSTALSPCMSKHERVMLMSFLFFHRDDLTVEVIFFGESAGSGSVTLNKEASAAAPEAKAKL